MANDQTRIVVKTINSDKGKELPFKNAVYLRIKNKSANSITYNFGSNSIELDSGESDPFPSPDNPMEGILRFEFGTGAIDIKVYIIEKI